MAFVDEITIHVKAGDGGDGAVQWRHEKNRDFGGPAGGGGGKGGDVYAVADRDTSLLARYRNRESFAAEDGGGGKSDELFGSNGDALNIKIPVGSVITNLTTNQKIPLEFEGQKELMLKGGRGGRGNASFKTSINRSPEQWTPGGSGEEADFYIELELIADIGLIGLPSAGKSTMLNALTRADVKTGAYHFTTLEPNLGVCYGNVLVDIPGLIEGASQGKGLGHKFLRHIKRTRMLAHLISLENEDLLATYELIRRELEQYNPELLEKKEIIIVTKTDLAEDEKALGAALSPLSKLKKIVLSVTFYDDDSVKGMRDALLKEIPKKDQNGSSET